MRIGITVAPAHPLESSGRNHTALHLGELFSALNHSVIFLHSGLHSWWESYPLPSYATEHFYTHPLSEPLDLLIDIDASLPAPIRKSFLQPGTHLVAFFRTFLQFSEMDASVYIETPIQTRSMESIHEIWCWDVLNPAETLPSIQTMFPTCPIRAVPFFWTPTLTNHFTKNQRAFCFSPEPSWSIHISEKNTNESSAIVPLVAIREATRRLSLASPSSSPPSIQFLVHRLDAMKENRFLQENILVPIELPTLPVSFAPATPFYDWVKTANHLFFSHSRFTPLRPALLALIWMGVPLFHNSSILRDLHPTLEEGYYTGNEISEWMTCLQRFLVKPSAWWEGQKERRTALLRRFGLTVHREAWSSFLNTIRPLSSPSLSPFPSSPSPSISSPSSSPSSPSPSKRPYYIVFSDMWPGFNPDTNFLLDTLRHYAPPHLTFHGSLYPSPVSPPQTDMAIVGPYSENWRTLPSSLPKVYFSAENWPLPAGADANAFSLYLLSSPDPSNSRHFRLPTWMTFIDWFTGANTLPPPSTDNPIRLPLHFATHPHPVPFADRAEFCAFVVSNPTQPFRNEAYQALTAYKTVNSGGALYNNIGGPLALLYPGGGGGDLSKHAFFAKHRFTLSAENSQRRGYITEKVLHAKMAGCVPLYWGDSQTDEDFAPHSMVNLSYLTKPADIVTIVKRLEAHPEFCARIAATPLLDKEKTERALVLLRTMSERILAILSPSCSNRFALSDPSPPSTAQDFAHIHVINLDRRRDRWESLLAAEPTLRDHTTRHSAVDGKTLTLTPSLARLFEHNTFHWKKGVIGCNLSHRNVWSAIEQDTASSSSPAYHLVLEDDVRFVPDWRSQWRDAKPHIPADADLLYLGGVLPPNRPALPHVLAPVNRYWATIQSNTFFSSTPAPIFHFCAYSYVLTPQGAAKLMNHLRTSKEKYYTVSDHLLGSPILSLTKYVMTPLIAHCFQEEDPAYQSSAFNQLQRTDTYDSDLWNNTDCFTPPPRLTTLYYMASPASPASPPSPPILYEHGWLQDMFQTWFDLQPLTHPDEATDPEAWYLLQRPHTPKWTEWLRHLQQKGKSLRLLHLSDEFCTDPLEAYCLPSVQAIVRTYSLLPPSSSSLTLSATLPLITLPLGYHYKASEENASIPFQQRLLTWSFHGTDWFDRKSQLVSLTTPEFQPCDLRLQPDWAHPTATAESEYLHALTNSKFCPILRGNHPETFRFYEALEARTLPVTTITDRVFVETVEKELALSELYSWTQPEKAMRYLLEHPEEGDRIQEVLSIRWNAWKARIQEAIKRVLIA